jgi:LmbE family N-acetylglucosaminyl deacetylase
MSGFEPGVFIDVSAYVDRKVRMLACHASQLQRGRDGDFAPLAELMTRQMQTRGTQSQVAAAECFIAANSFKRSRAW